jgi:hypothetical protein
VFDVAGIGQSRGPWTLVEPMNYSRWYPTAVVTKDGRIAIFGGFDETAVGTAFGPEQSQKIPEIYDPSEDEPQWRAFPDCGAPGHVEYPFSFLLPSGNILIVGPRCIKVAHILWRTAESTWRSSVVATPQIPHIFL